jgi:hypothetical protein
VLEQLQVTVDFVFLNFETESQRGLETIAQHFRLVAEDLTTYSENGNLRVNHGVNAI